MSAARDEALFRTAVTEIMTAQTEHLQWMQDEYGARMGEVPMSPQHFKFVAARILQLARLPEGHPEILGQLLYHLDCLRATAAADCIHDIKT